jgi:hypothetical protein
MKSYFSLLFLLTHIWPLLTKDLPGLDFLATGFDALKMINLNEVPSASDKLKFRLFNLDDGLGKTYLFDADGIKHSYTTSRYVQATTINMKTKVAVETISKTYKEFRHK